MNLTRAWGFLVALGILSGGLALTFCSPAVQNRLDPKPAATPRPTSGSVTQAHVSEQPRTLQQKQATSPATGTECTDGIDNDGDGLTDWAYDPGCYGRSDRTEKSGPRASEDGFSTWEFEPGSVVVYVAASGNDESPGTLAAPVRTLHRASELVRDGAHDFIRLRRGDTWHEAGLGRFKSGRDASHPLVIGAYGNAPELPRIEVPDSFINHDGDRRSFVALVDLHLVPYRKDPLDPDFDGTGSGLIRYVGNGSHLLIEGCHLEYGEIVLQSYGGPHYEDVDIRANVIEKSYHVGTCVPGDPRGNHDYRPSGIYSSHVERLTIEGNLFDHNGWNEDVETACATIYNHNIYVNGNDLRIARNVFARASSIHVKLRSDDSGGMKNITIDDNFFVEGEIGISAGGNTKEPFRFERVTIGRNVLSDIGRTCPTTRNLAWAIDSSDTADLVLTENLILNQREPRADNSYGIMITGTQRNARIERNLLYRVQGRAIVVKPTGPQEAVMLVDNTVVDPDQGSVFVDHEGPLKGYRYAKNRYFGAAQRAAWFRVAGTGLSVEQWRRASGEQDEPTPMSPTFSDPGRNIESYAAALGFDASLESFLTEARARTRANWSSELTASAINDYLRRGFDR